MVMYLTVGSWHVHWGRHVCLKVAWQSMTQFNQNNIWSDIKVVNLVSSVGFPSSSAGKEYTCNVGDLGWIPGLGRSSREGKVYPLQYSGLENSMDSIVHGVAKSQTWLSNLKKKLVCIGGYLNNTVWWQSHNSLILPLTLIALLSMFSKEWHFETWVNIVVASRFRVLA